MPSLRYLTIVSYYEYLSSFRKDNHNFSALLASRSLIKSGCQLKTFGIIASFSLQYLMSSSYSANADTYLANSLEKFFVLFKYLRLS